MAAYTQARLYAAGQDGVLYCRGQRRMRRRLTIDRFFGPDRFSGPDCFFGPDWPFGPDRLPWMPNCPTISELSPAMVVAIRRTFRGRGSGSAFKVLRTVTSNWTGP